MQGRGRGMGDGRRGKGYGKVRGIKRRGEGKGEWVTRKWRGKGGHWSKQSEHGQRPDDSLVLRLIPVA